MKPRFSFAEQIAMIAESLKAYWRIFAVSLGGFAALFAASLLLAHRRESVLRLLASQWVCLLTVAAALGLYGLVHVEARYIGPFAILFGVAALNTLALPRAAKPRRVLLYLAAAWLMLLTAKAVYSGFRAAPPAVNRAARLASGVAAEMAKQGVRKGDKIATLTASPGRWDRMLGVRVAAHAEWWLDGVEDKFWALIPKERQAIYTRLGDLKLKGIVLEASRRRVEEPGWKQLGDTKHYWRPLPEAGPSSPADPPATVE
jgi:hypothetical protein